MGYKTGAITYEFETKTFNYDRGIRLFADVMDVEEAGVNDCFAEPGLPVLQLHELASVTGMGNLGNVRSMRYTFSSYAFTTLDLRGFDPSHLFYCFSGCGSLTTILADSAWALPSSGISGMQCFYSCKKLAGGNGTA